MHRPGVEEVQGADEASGKLVIHPERDLQVLREPDVGIEQAEPRAGPRGNAGGRLVDGIELGDLGTPAVEEQLLATVVAIGVAEPAIGRRAAEEPDPAPQERAPCAPDVIVDPKTRRPEHVAARQPSGVHAERGLERVVRGHGVRQEGHVEPDPGRDGQRARRAPAILYVQG